MAAEVQCLQVLVHDVDRRSEYVGGGAGPSQDLEYGEGPDWYQQEGRPVNR